LLVLTYLRAFHKAKGIDEVYTGGPKERQKLQC